MYVQDHVIMVVAYLGGPYRHHYASEGAAEPYRADQRGSWVRDRTLPSGSRNQATWAPPGAVHTPAWSWSMPSYLTNSTPRPARPATVSWIAATSQPNTVKGGGVSSSTLVTRSVIGPTRNTQAKPLTSCTGRPRAPS